MIAVVYSGSHYADWRLADKDRVIASFKTSGINPYLNDEKGIIQLLSKNINLIHHAEEIKKIYFFGAGASSPELKAIVQNAFAIFFKHGKVSVEHDIQAAAIACCKNNQGIVCIIGSGSNAAWYDGKKIKPNNYGLGYILADEGSGNWLGRQLIKRYMNETLPANIQKKFVQRYDLDRKTLLEKVYRQKQPALFLSSFTDFFIENKEDHYIKSIIKNGFSQLFNTYLLPLHDAHPEAFLYFAGLVAADFQGCLYEAADEANLKIANVIKEPINNLLTYYSSKN
jgi:N-acetylglucosamine kinase-like BadF-type ATPase